MLKTFAYRLYPSKPQTRLLDSTLETCRRWYNQCLAERRDAYQQHGLSVGKYQQLAKVKEKKASNPYAKGIHSHVLQTVVADLDKAFQAFFRRVKAGEDPGYPRFKGRDRFSSFGFKEYGNGFKIDGRRLRLSGIGRIAVRWHRPLEGQIKTVRIIRKAGLWYACFACDVEAVPQPPTGQEIGIDVGVASLITNSDGEDLRITNMARNPHLAKSILDAGWGYLVEHLTSKAAEAGRVVCLVDPRYTSKSCSQCGHIFESLSLSDRWIDCGCGLSLDRDHNAAINILKRAGQVRWGISSPVGGLPQEAVPF